MTTEETPPKETPPCIRLHIRRNRIYIITEADRSSTCILLPEEY
jgi:hypothetical protein